MLRLVVVPCLNAHKRHVRDPPPLPITLLGVQSGPTIRRSYGGEALRESS